MKKLLIASLMTFMMLVVMAPAVTLTADAATAPTKMWVESTEVNGLPITIEVLHNTIKVSGRTYTYDQLFLPGNVDLDKCFLSWDGDMEVTLNGKNYKSGECPILSLNTELTYTFKNGNQTSKTFKVTTYQGSKSVPPVFIEIDESNGNPTIEQMNASTDHSVECTGQINIDHKWYELSKMKGRGNASWKESDDKKPYNITLGKKINFPGVDSEKTKKWSFLAEVLDHSLMCNRTGYHLAYELGIGQDTTSADVWMNGEYIGCYTVTPKTDSFVPDDGYALEEDNYLEPEGGDPQFELDGLKRAKNTWSSCYNLITVKKIGDDLLSDEVNKYAYAENTIKPWMQNAWDSIRFTDGDYEQYIDTESFARMYLMHEFVKSFDVCAGSILFHRDGTSDDDKLIAGPLWDLDNAMGSVYNNGDLGSQADRRSAEGSFIANITEYKTSIYKTFGVKHPEFLIEVKRQYNLNRAAFESFPNDAARMINEIRDSAMMNHMKVNDLGNDYTNGKNNHYYGSDTTLSPGEYVQKYVKTGDSRASWPSYAQNLNTYIRVRCKWFSDNYKDANYNNVSAIFESTDGGEYTVTVQKGDESTSNTATGGYNCTLPVGARVTVTADPKKGFFFDGWYKGVIGSNGVIGPSGSALSTESEYTFATESGKDICLYAKFEECTHNNKTAHAAVEATCTEAGNSAYWSCETCGEYFADEEGTREIEEGSWITAATGHNMTAHAAVEATCTEAGNSAYWSCDACGKFFLGENGATEIEENSWIIDALGHVEEVDAAAAPTCTETGLTEGKHCSRCNEILIAQEEVLPTGHTEVADKAVAPTCTETGLTAGSHCSVCGEVLVAQETVPANGHTEVTDEAIEPTCTEEGMTAGSHCSVCGEVLVAQETVPANGHTEVTDEAIAPTCTETGLTAGSHCSVCGEVLVAQETVPANGHTEVTDEAIEPTCTEEGRTAGSHCSVCEYVIVSTQKVPALGHSWDNGKVTIEPTCTEAGEKTFTCSRCSEKRTETIGAAGHKWNNDYTVDTPATHSETGVESIHCSVCNAIKPDSERVIPVIEHEFGDWEITKAATCTTDGSKKRTCIGEDCGYVETAVIPAAGHSYSKEFTVDTEPTCTEAGSKSKHCTVCGEKDETSITSIPALGHNWDNGKVTKEPTCTEAGEKTFTCSRCHETRTETIGAAGHKWNNGYTVDTPATHSETGIESIHCSVCNVIKPDSERVIPVTEHEFGDWEITKAATCTTDGSKRHTCIDEGCGYVETVTIPATGHKWKSDYTIDTEPTCTEAGSKSKHCTVCGEKDEASITSIPALDHDWDNGKVAKEPTCTEAGEKTFTCSRCNEIRTEVIAAKGHKWNETYTVDTPATCTAEGSESIHCSRCDTINELTATVIPKTDHTYGSWETTKEPKCTEAGLRQKVCTYCKDSKLIEEIPATGHSWNNDYTVDTPATHSETGIESIHCSVCNVIKPDSERVIPVTEHEFGDWEITKVATCTTDGSKRHTCIDEGCGYVETVTIPATGHKWKSDYTIDKKAACTEDGSESIHCSVCNAIKPDSERVIMATGHKYSDWKLVMAATVDEEGSRERICSVCGDKETQVIEKLDAQAVADAAIAEAAEAAAEAERAEKEAAQAQAEADEAAKTPGEEAVAAAMRAITATKYFQSVAAKAKEAAVKAKTASDKAVEIAKKAKVKADEAVEEAKKAYDTAKTESDKAAAEKAVKEAAEAANKAAEAVEAANKTAESAENAETKAAESLTKADQAIKTAEESVTNAEKSVADHIGVPVIKLSKTVFTYKYNVKKVKKRRTAVATKQKPKVTVTLNGKTISADNYVLTWSNKNSSAIGKYSVKVTLKGQYSGEARAEYRIVPKRVSIGKIAKGKKKFTVTWKKLSKNDIKYKVITGYQMRYATKADFSDKKIIKAGSLKSAKKVISKLGTKKKYYVQIRTYKIVGGKKYCSAWSKTKTIKTK